MNVTLFPRYLLLLFFDVQYIFSPEIGDVSKMSDLEAYNHAVYGICKLQSKLTDLPLGRPSKSAVRARSTMSADMVYPYMFLSSHSHFVNYGGESVKRTEQNSTVQHRMGYEARMSSTATCVIVTSAG